MRPVRRPYDDRTSAGGGPSLPERWVFRLYTVGITPATETALKNLREICSERLAVEPEIQVVDLAREPELAVTHGIFAVPMVVRQAPPPVRKVIGDLSDRDRAMAGLEMGSL